MENLLLTLNGVTPFAVLGLIVLLFVQGRNKQDDQAEKLKLELVKLVGAAVSNIEQSTAALRSLHTAELETQRRLDDSQRRLEEHHEHSKSIQASVIAAVEAVPGKAAEKTDEKLAPRFVMVQQLLESATHLIAALADDVKRNVNSEECEAGADGTAVGTAEKPDGAEQSAEQGASVTEGSG